MGLGDVVGRGRDAVILDHGDGLVLRRPLETRMMDVEARVMAWVHEHGYPSPRLVEMTTLGLVMERVDGPTMLQDAFTQPRRAQEHMRTLADLHHRLHALPVPPGLDQPLGRARSCSTRTCTRATCYSGPTDLGSSTGPTRAPVRPAPTSRPRGC